TVFVGNPQLQSDLASYMISRSRVPGASDYLLLNQRGKPLTPQGLRLRLRRLSEDLNISPRVTPHRFRHTAATLLIEEGLDIRLVQRLLGHSSISTTEIYTHVSDTSLRSAMSAADHIGKIAF
ncbi:MAG: tyrosine-type recombinase/integrase, partial [Nitratireductor sp.]